jgi:hypothetical protein
MEPQAGQIWEMVQNTAMVAGKPRRYKPLSVGAKVLIEGMENDRWVSSLNDAHGESIPGTRVVVFSYFGTRRSMELDSFYQMFQLHSQT